MTYRWPERKQHTHPRVGFSRHSSFHGTFFDQPLMTEAQPLITPLRRRARAQVGLPHATPPVGPADPDRHLTRRRTHCQEGSAASEHARSAEASWGIGGSTFKES